MIQELQKKQLKKVLTILAIAVAIGGFFGYFSKMAIIDLVKGPIPLTAESNLEELEGSYVSWELKYPMGEFIEIKKKTRVRGYTSSPRRSRAGYVAFDPEREILIAVELPAKRDEEVEEQMDLFYEAMESGDELPQTGLSVKGELEKLDSESRKYFLSALRGTGLSELVDGDVYQIADGEIKGDKPETIIFIAGFVALLFALLFGELILTVKKSVKKTFESYINANPSITMEAMENDFAQAEKVGGIWVGRRWTYGQMLEQYFIDNSKLVYTHIREESGRNGTSYWFCWHMLDGTQEKVSASEKNCRKLLEITARMPHVVASNDPEVAYLYQHNREQFLNLRYRGQGENQQQ